MGRIRSRNTKPEIIVRSLLHRSGFRFRINYAALPGAPDIALPKHKTAIFVHGCFWHRHTECPRATFPNTNRAYWRKKFDRNVARDAEIGKELKRLKWNVIVVWECEVMADPFLVLERIVNQLSGTPYTKIALEIDRRQIMAVAEKKSHYYLDGKRRNCGKNSGR